MGKYYPEAPPLPEVGNDKQREIIEWTHRELNRISTTLFTDVYLNLEKKFVAPPKPQEGDITYADGVSWDPGSGEGIYAYESGGWVLLG
jgi:hypothetical protein